ncbi:MAG: ArsR family transcriptional regulator, partial [Candidatus Hydrothermarchaeota archaeon]
ELDIPIATVYRKIKSLEDAELIKHVKTIINISGNEEKYYKSNVGRVSLTFSGGRLFVKVEKEDYSDKFVRLWKRLSK